MNVQAHSKKMKRLSHVNCGFGEKAASRNKTVVSQQRFNVEQWNETDREGEGEDSLCGWLVVSETSEAIPTCHPWKFPGREPLGRSLKPCSMCKYPWRPASCPAHELGTEVQFESGFALWHLKKSWKLTQGLDCCVNLQTNVFYVRVLRVCDLKWVYLVFKLICGL